MTDYLDNFTQLEYKFAKDREVLRLWNLKNMNGMEVAELLTYLYDDGYIHKGPMSSKNRNGLLVVMK